MIAISSHRPHGKSVEFRRNQLLAKRSWESAFTRIVYAGSEEPELKSQKTSFVEAEEWPTIQTLAQIASEQPAQIDKPIAIINADIVIGQRFGNVKNRMTFMRCASSRRWHFDPHAPNYDRAELIDADRGRDIFVAQRRIWRHISRVVPPHLRIGHQQWDAWVTDFFNDNHKAGFFDFTNMKCIFHPFHGDRQMPYANTIAQQAAA